MHNVYFFLGFALIAQLVFLYLQTTGYAPQSRTLETK